MPLFYLGVLWIIHTVVQGIATSIDAVHVLQIELYLKLLFDCQEEYTERIRYGRDLRMERAGSKIEKLYEHMSIGIDKRRKDEGHRNLCRSMNIYDLVFRSCHS